MRGHDGSVPVYFEAAAVITVLVLLGQVLELKAREQTSGAIRALLDLSPKMARRIRPDGTDEDVSLDQVVVGDRLRVRPGERVPVDGEILEGRSAIDESMVTGESMPVTKSVGEKVIGGTMNQSGGFVMRADKVGRDTVLARIVQMVAQAQRSRAPIQRLADQVSGWFVPAVIVAALLAFVCVVDLGTGAALHVWPDRGRLRAHHRLPLRAGSRHADVDHGRRRARRAIGRADQECRGPGASREGRHPGDRQDRHADRGQAERRGDQDRGRHRGNRAAAPDGKPRAQQRASAGRRHRAVGERARPFARSGRELRLARRQRRHGLRRWAEAGDRQSADHDRGRHRYEQPRRDAPTSCAAKAPPPSSLPSTARRPASSPLPIPIKATTPAAISALKAAGIRVVMLTGDNATTAKAVAQKLGITDVEAEVLPEDKSKIVERFRQQGRVVAMAGDGVNDAPALAAADVGIAMGTGTDVAMESAGVTLLKGDLNGIVRARHLSAATMANIRQNLFFAFIYNAAGVPVAAGVLYPLFGVLLSPIIAAAAMALSSVSVIGNALRLNRVRL